MFQSSPSLLLHARIRLTPDERDRLKDAYFQYRRSTQPAAAGGVETTSPNGGGLTVETHTNVDSLIEKRLGMGSIVVTDLLNSRESISLPVMLSLQSLLGVEVVSKERFMEAAESYCEYIWSKTAQA